VRLFTAKQQQNNSLIKGQLQQLITWWRRRERIEEDVEGDDEEDRMIIGPKRKTRWDIKMREKRWVKTGKKHRKVLVPRITKKKTDCIIY